MLILISDSAHWRHISVVLVAFWTVVSMETAKAWLHKNHSKNQKSRKTTNYNNNQIAEYVCVCFFFRSPLHSFNLNHKCAAIKYSKFKEAKKHFDRPFSTNDNIIFNEKGSYTENYQTNFENSNSIFIIIFGISHTFGYIVDILSPRNAILNTRNQTHCQFAIETGTLLILLYQIGFD